MNDFNITLFEACEFLNKSKKSISRYIRRGLLHPKRIKSKQGTLEYRFSNADLEAFKQNETGQEMADMTDQPSQYRQTELELEEEQPKYNKEKAKPEETDQPSQDKTRKTGQNDDIIILLKETTGLLKEQLQKKDEQIKDLSGKIDELIERDRETNILIGQLQNKVFLLEKPKEETKQDRPKQTRQDEVNKVNTKRHKTTITKPTKVKQDKVKINKEQEKPKKVGFWKRLFSKKA